MNIIITGPAGSGKTTQAKLLSDYLGTYHLNAGDLLYYASLGDTPDAAHIKEKMEKGEIVDEDVTIRLVNNYLEEKQEKGIVIEGYPRTLKEASNIKIPIDKVFYINVSDEEVTNRLLKRGRSDDTPETIQKRLQIYHEETEPLVNFFKEKGILEKINGEQEIEKIFQEIKSRVE